MRPTTRYKVGPSFCSSTVTQEQYLYDSYIDITHSGIILARVAQSEERGTFTILLCNPKAEGSSPSSGDIRCIVFSFVQMPTGAEYTFGPE